MILTYFNKPLRYKPLRYKLLRYKNNSNESSRTRQASGD